MDTMDTEENPYGTGLTFVSLVSYVSNPRIEKPLALPVFRIRT
jgi:hypothetical protein